MLSPGYRKYLKIPNKHYSKNSWVHSHCGHNSAEFGVHKQYILPPQKQQQQYNHHYHQMKRSHLNLGKQFSKIRSVQSKYFKFTCGPETVALIHNACLLRSKHHRLWCDLLLSRHAVRLQSYTSAVPKLGLGPTSGSCCNFCWVAKVAGQITLCASRLEQDATWEHCCPIITATPLGIDDSCSCL